MRALMDDVVIDSAEEGGTRVTLIATSVGPDSG